MNRRTLLSRSGMFLATFFAMVAMFATSATQVRAQTTDCCDTIYVSVGNLNCNVIKFCILTSAGRICNAYGANTLTAIPYRCDIVDVRGAFLIDACGDTIRIPRDTCINNILAGPHCCINFCFGRTATGCPAIRITGANGCVPCTHDGGGLGDLREEPSPIHLVMKED